VIDVVVLKEKLINLL